MIVDVDMDHLAWRAAAEEADLAYYRAEDARRRAAHIEREAQRDANARTARMPLADPPPYWDRRALSEWAMGPGF